MEPSLVTEGAAARYHIAVWLAEEQHQAVNHKPLNKRLLLTNSSLGRSSSRHFFSHRPLLCRLVPAIAPHPTINPILRNRTKMEILPASGWVPHVHWL